MVDATMFFERKVFNVMYIRLRKMFVNTLYIFVRQSTKKFMPKVKEIVIRRKYVCVFPSHK